MSPLPRRLSGGQTVCTRSDELRGHMSAAAGANRRAWGAPTGDGHERSVTRTPPASDMTIPTAIAQTLGQDACIQTTANCGIGI